MRYEGNIFRPPSEAYSLILQVTIGCAHNGCTFCSMFKDKKFRIRPVEEVIEDLQWARKRYSRVEKFFLADGDALVLSNENLMVILNTINELFPECRQTTVYGSPQDVLRKKDTELQELRKAGVKIIYIGAESGNDVVLSNINKGATRAEIIEAVKKIEAAGIKASVTFISGLGGKDLWREHAIDTGTMISEMNPTYVGLLTLMLDDAAPITEDVRSGKFKLLTAEEVVVETELLLQNINVTEKCIFRSNHASNYVSLKGDLPDDKEAMLRSLRRCMEDRGLLKDEIWRAL